MPVPRLWPEIAVYVWRAPIAGWTKGPELLRLVAERTSSRVESLARRIRVYFFQAIEPANLVDFLRLRWGRCAHWWPWASPRTFV